MEQILSTKSMRLFTVFTIKQRNKGKHYSSTATEGMLEKKKKYILSRYSFNRFLVSTKRGQKYVNVKGDRP